MMIKRGGHGERGRRNAIDVKVVVEVEVCVAAACGGGGLLSKSRAARDMSGRNTSR
jgi:hypothetical protein